MLVFLQKKTLLSLAVFPITIQLQRLVPRGHKKINREDYAPAAEIIRGGLGSPRRKAAGSLIEKHLLM
ncbi:hypothetical protein [Lederbergia citrea]|uniref:Uncharacterized protein n=1 Tax=Lederbergia citrea TaxID=2833581 RepID=A0A942Z6E2_9BACI|nr:hypothetical protein [Lederbergia citrea]MBS4178601.1 hypothetical protein [Lederbergia citrea]MBS4224400.1 hypothetical protein [Lederbergia citrea]